MRRLIVFDLDGTLIDSFDSVADCINYALRSLGLNVMSKDVLKRYIGAVPLDEIFSSVSKDRAGELVRIYREEYQRRFHRMVRPVRGMRKVLKELKGRGYEIAVVTLKASELARRVLEEQGLIDGIDMVIGWDSIGSKDPKRVAREIERRGGYEVVAYIGDRQKDMEVGRELGAMCIGVLYGMGGREELVGYADRLIEDPEDLLRLF